MSKVNEMKTRYNDSAYIDDFGDYQIVSVDKRDSDWLIEQAEMAEELREENKRLKEEIENIQAEHEFQLNTRDE
ncbi:hypothetical protein ABKP09_20015 [Peribacillus frigoritolerans]|uniref:hypothetical protein n=1 Tax=Peribacillus frigoritolerans TaxID=450367 RepID=UPI0032B57C34